MKESLGYAPRLGRRRGGGGYEEGSECAARRWCDRGGSSWRGALWRGEGEGKRQDEGRGEEGEERGRYEGVWGRDWGSVAGRWV